VAPQPTKLDLWIENLALKESGNNATALVFDSNKRYSYGCLQFQMATFQFYMKMYGLGTASSTAGWKALIYDCGIQKQLAKAMIQDKQSNWKHWYNTVMRKGVGKPPVEVAVAPAAPATPGITVAVSLTSAK